MILPLPLRRLIFNPFTDLRSWLMKRVMKSFLGRNAI